jgi:hypothetical protein
MSRSAPHVIRRFNFDYCSGPEDDLKIWPVFPSNFPSGASNFGESPAGGNVIELVLNASHVQVCVLDDSRVNDGANADAPAIGDDADHDSHV